MAHSETFVQDRLRQLMPGLLVYTKGRHYQDCLELYNRALNKQPLVCARPRTEEEVLRLVQFCTEETIPFAVRSGGHDFFGRSSVHEGILIDMRAMDMISVQPDRASARVSMSRGHVVEGTASMSECMDLGLTRSSGLGWF
jgi:FAD/FMN-containing dehydrogenase